MTTEAETVAKLAVDAAPKAQFVKSSDGREYLVTPGNYTASDVTDPVSLPLHQPKLIRQSVALQTADSLVEYVGRFKGVDTILFADIEKSIIAAQIDYHAPNKAAHSAHRAVLTLASSIEWQAWNSISGILHGQLEFARFVEENGADIRAPDAGELLECVRDLQAHRRVNFTRAVRTSSENENFEYSDETNASSRKGGIEIPTKFVLGIPVYFGERDTELHAFLRWKLDDGILKLGIQLHRSEHVRQAVFKGVVLDIASRTACMAVFGKIG